MPTSASTSAIVRKCEANVLQFVADWNAALIVSFATTAIHVLFVPENAAVLLRVVGVVRDVKSISCKMEQF